MNFQCYCGEIIADQTDDLFYKARCIADEDWTDFLESDRPGIGLDWRFARIMYQCPKCGRLYVQRPDRNSSVVFKIEEGEERDKKLLVSTKELQWKRLLTGAWDSSGKSNPTAKGELWFRDCYGDGFEKHNDWAVMEKRYYELFEQLRQADTLRLADLIKDGKTLHRWPKSD
jgi:hypothetical protein